MKDPKAKANGSGLSWRGKLRNAGRKLVSVQKFQAAGSCARVGEATAQSQADSEDSSASPCAATSVAEIARLPSSPSRERRNSKALLVRETSATPRACAATSTARIARLGAHLLANGSRQKSARANGGAAGHAKNATVHPADTIHDGAIDCRSGGV